MGEFPTKKNQVRKGKAENNTFSCSLTMKFEAIKIYFCGRSKSKDANKFNFPHRRVNNSFSNQWDLLIWYLSGSFFNIPAQTHFRWMNVGSRQQFRLSQIRPNLFQPFSFADTGYQETHFAGIVNHFFRNCYPFLTR